MPKIIENIREKLLTEARRQVMEQGYVAMTIRSVASACGVGVGTVYNYFPSKDMLIASFMLEDWLQCREIIKGGCREENTAEEALRCIFDELCRFNEKYAVLFSDKAASASSSNAFEQRHIMLRSQIAEPLLVHCQKQTKADAHMLSEFIAESLLVWSHSEHTFEEVKTILLQLF